MRKKGDLPLNAEEIAQAKHLAALGYSERHIGRELKRSPHAIARLLRTPDAVNEVAIEKVKLADIFERLTHQTLESITLRDIEKASFLQRVTGAAIMVDKTQLLRGGPTAIVDVRVLMDLASLIRRDEDVPRPAPRTLTVAADPEPASVPLGAGYSHAASPPTPDPAPTVRVHYHTQVEPVREEPYDPLMQGLGKH